MHCGVHLFKVHIQLQRLSLALPLLSLPVNYGGLHTQSASSLLVDLRTLVFTINVKLAFRQQDCPNQAS